MVGGAGRLGLVPVDEASCSLVGWWGVAGRVEGAGGLFNLVVSIVPGRMLEAVLPGGVGSSVDDVTVSGWVVVVEVIEGWLVWAVEVWVVGDTKFIVVIVEGWVVDDWVVGGWVVDTNFLVVRGLVGDWVVSMVKGSVVVSRSVNAITSSVEAGWLVDAEGPRWVMDTLVGVWLTGVLLVSVVGGWVVDTIILVVGSWAVDAVVVVSGRETPLVVLMIGGVSLHE